MDTLRVKRVKEKQGFPRYSCLSNTSTHANDQVKRIEKYMGLIGKTPLQLDSVRREELVKKKGLTSLRFSIGTSNLIVTNPDFSPP